MIHCIKSLIQEVLKMTCSRCPHFLCNLCTPVRLNLYYTTHYPKMKCTHSSDLVWNWTQMSMCKKKKVFEKKYNLKQPEDMMVVFSGLFLIIVISSRLLSDCYNSTKLRKICQVHSLIQGYNCEALCENQPPYSSLGLVRVSCYLLHCKALCIGVWGCVHYI